ncbi:MAG: hypothetical protein LBE27_04465, partial [Deltaproteobacteria bacterium]|nr:hypothetical protein [Deltaproteobacteria bacterium]
MPTKISNSSHIRAINGKTKKPGVLSSFRAVLAKPFSRQYRNHTILVAVVALVTAFLTNPLPDSYQVGSVATRTYRSDRPLDIPDPLLTREERQKAVQNVVPIFIMDDNVASDALQTLRSIFRRGRQLILGGAKEFPEGFVVDFSDVFGKDKTSDQVLDLLERVKLEKFSSNLERSVTWLTLELLSQGILDETASLSGYTGTEIEISRAGTGISQASLSSLLTLETARGLVEPRAQLLATDLEEAGGELIEELTLSFLKPNLILDTGTLSAMRKQAELSVPELHHHVAAGEIIVREGETVSPLILLKLQALSKEASSRWLMRTIGILLIFFVFLAVTEAISTMDRREHSKSETVLMTFILLMYVILAWASIGLGRGLNRGFDFIENRTLFLVMPIPAAAMLATIFLGRRRAIFVAFLGSILAAAVAPLDTLEAFIYLCTGSLVSILHLSRISERSRFIPSSIMCALVNALTILGINFTSGTLHLKPLSYEIFAAMGSG